MAAERQAETLVRERRLGALRLGSELVGRRVQRRPLESVLDLALKTILTPAASTDVEVPVVVVTAATLLILVPPWFNPASVGVPASPKPP